MKNTVIIAHIRNNGFTVGKPFVVEIAPGLFQEKEKKEVTIVGYTRIPRTIDHEPLHILTLEDGTELSVWDHLISKSSEELNQIYDA